MRPAEITHDIERSLEGPELVDCTPACNDESDWLLLDADAVALEERL